MNLDLKFENFSSTSLIKRFENKIQHSLLYAQLIIVYHNQLISYQIIQHFQPQFMESGKDQNVNRRLASLTFVVA